MKRLPVIIVFFSLLLLGFSSCKKKCYHCEFKGYAEETFCPKDFPDGRDGLNMTIDAYKKQGYTCTEQD